MAVLLLFLGLPCSGEESVRHILTRDGRTLDLRVNTQFEPAMQQNLLEWVDFIAATLAQVYGHWPRREWQVVVAPISSMGSDPIPWAQVHRGKIDQVEFFTVPGTTTEDLKRAWTGYHELAHLLLPYRGWGDVWFSEGLASYYQNLLQVRAGILTEQQMWQKLYDGYLRGRADTRFDGRELQSVSDELRREGGFMRVYWSGAWYFLAADAQLRQRSGGKHTLDSALALLNRCCADQSLSVAAMVRKLDELNQVVLFQPLYDEVTVSTRIPPYAPIFASLGIAISNGKVVLQADGPGAGLRKQLVASQGL